MEEAKNVTAKPSHEDTGTTPGAVPADAAPAGSNAAGSGSPGPGTAGSSRAATDTRNTGPGRLLIAVYAVFAISATARAGYQILTKFSEAPLAYLLSAFAAVVYLVATVSLAKSGRTWFKVSVAAVLVELVGVLVVGALSVFDSVNFPHETVWSLFGRGYAFIPLLLPILGLIWLYRRRPAPKQA
ncbi:hypothetical protein NicSoilB4_11800 [Arthrobacter sp. NicSoilB4]|uniref:hypothetical protein n=1 Tax=Arthrobacter sp. NicSoilB4 TaxID=2830997 RepID=UPI001E7FA56F|nr:hypothetical protein NicSoilB4_11800 [Arthrobacter sp. NicSoilB4]